MNDKKAHSQLTAIWNKYNQVRLTGDRKAANKILADYIDLLKQQNEKDIKIIVDNICSLALDGDKKITSSNEKEESDKDTRIQHPLFKEIILPILQDQYKRGSAEHIKWIGQMEQFFYSDYTTTRAFLIDLSIPGYFEARQRRDIVEIPEAFKRKITTVLKASCCHKQHSFSPLNTKNTIS
jgi:hypothetical protein